MPHAIVNIKYVPVEDAMAEWVDKVGLTKRYEGLNIYTLNRWLTEMRSNKKFNKYVINPSHKKVWIHIEGFHEFLQWRQKNYASNPERRRK